MVAPTRMACNNSARDWSVFEGRANEWNSVWRLCVFAPRRRGSAKDSAWMRRVVSDRFRRLNGRASRRRSHGMPGETRVPMCCRHPALQSDAWSGGEAGPVGVLRSEHKVQGVLMRKGSLLFWLSVSPLSVLQAQYDQACPRWSAPRPIAAADGRPVYVESPFVTAMGKGDFLLISTPTIVWHSARVFADTGRADPRTAPDSVIGVRIDQAGHASVIPRPPVAGEIIWPRATYRRGVAHVVWATSSDTTRFAAMSPTTLWYARFDGRRWTSVERVFGGRRVVWNETSAPVTFVDGQPRLIAPAADSSSRADHQGLVYLSRATGGVWRRSWIATRGPLPLFSSQVSAGTTSVAAFLGTVLHPGRSGELNSVFVARSVDGGSTWSSPASVRALNQVRGFGLQLLGQIGSSLHLVWALEFGQSTKLVHAVSFDAGVAWRDTATLILPRVEALSAAMFRDHPVVAGRRVGVDSIVTVVLGTARTSSLTALPFERASGLPRLSRVGRDSLALVWSVDRPGAYPLAPQVIPLASMIAIATPHCS